MTHLDVYNVCQNHVDFAIQRKELISTSSERMHLVNSMLRAQRQGLTSSWKRGWEQEKEVWLTFWCSDSGSVFMAQWWSIDAFTYADWKTWKAWKLTMGIFWPWLPKAIESAVVSSFRPNTWRGSRNIGSWQQSIDWVKWSNHWRKAYD